MAISPKLSFERLLDIVELLSGCSLAQHILPIVGGSIPDRPLSGRTSYFPYGNRRASVAASFSGFDEVEAGIVKWPMSVIRLRSEKER